LFVAAVNELVVLADFLFFVEGKVVRTRGELEDIAFEALRRVIWI
jgi:hypothetical protein